MKAFALLSLASVAFAGVNVFEKRACAGNNCNRAITGTRDGLPATTLRQADCTSFLLTIVTPSPVVSTTWVESTDSTTLATQTSSPAVATGAVTLVPSVPPTYATQCSSAAAYASACLCWGVTASVSTAPTPTVTVTSTYGWCEL